VLAVVAYKQSLDAVNSKHHIDLSPGLSVNHSPHFLTSFQTASAILHNICIQVWPKKLSL